MTHHPESLMSHAQHSLIKKLPLQLLEIVSFGLVSFCGFQTCMWISCSVNKPSQISCNGAAEPLQGSDGVVVITSALHAEGREFDPRSDLVRFKSIISMCLLSNWSEGQKISHDAGHFIFTCQMWHTCDAGFNFRLAVLKCIHALFKHKLVAQKIFVHQPGVEPGSTAWKATMLTVTPLMLLRYVFMTGIYLRHRQLLIGWRLGGRTSHWPCFSLRHVVRWCSGYHVCFTRRRSRVQSSLGPWEFWVSSSGWITK